ncbi:glycosyltransferase family 4 protein [Hymenobacter sp. NST-14]|uniref:glycosyltransferase family 4 protein n=1 Tax=Hymenobacter piscis TaxID=2839984 RepID=UPI001C037DC7|nr:glycosyltransferase family 1 protein [Hymenobacter piscis]MBT9393577.1 glycosyltransferase family 4 protein [Hymenobacter piscis]
MRLLYDHQAFSLQDFGGVSRYHHELLCHASWQSELAVVLSNNLYLREGRYRPRTFLPDSRLPARWRVIRYVNERASRRALRRNAFDVFHPTLLDDDYFLPLLAPERPLVVTIHDMIPALFPAHYPDRDDTTLRNILQRASRIITVSEHTRADVLRLLPVAPERVRVVYHGYTEPAGAPAAALPVPARYVLFTGSRALYKNFGCLLEALALLPAAETADLHLVCAGGGPFTGAEREQLARTGWANRAHQFGPVSDAQLSALYRGARAFVFPSEYEGFGLPILEAYGQQCPVLLSAASCFPEIARDAALYFPPDQPAALAQQLSRLLEDAPLRRQLVQLGQLRLLDFTWQHTARRTRAVYEEALQEARPGAAATLSSTPLPALKL